MFLAATTPRRTGDCSSMQDSSSLSTRWSPPTNRKAVSFLWVLAQKPSINLLTDAAR
jgi:hypothetical protein